MDLKAQFEQAVKDIKQVTKKPTNEELLDLYALFKQATAGDCTGDRPGMLDFKGRAKYDAWANRKGLKAESAMESYIALVRTLEKKYK